MKRLKGFLLMVIFIVIVSPGIAAAYVTQNVVVIVLCGVRGTESFLDPSHQYVPNIWNNLRPLGVVNTNMQTFADPVTVPGHHALLTGTYSGFRTTTLKLTQERFRLHEPTIFEELRKTLSLSEMDVFAITGGSAMLNHEDYSIHPLFGVDYKATLVSRDTDSINDLKTQSEIYSAMDNYHPRLLFATFKGSDIYGHRKNWTGYINNIKLQDQIIYEIWNKIESDPFYSGKTTLFVIGDHGRHDDAHGGFQDHGGLYLDDGSRIAPFLAIGPDFVSNQIHSYPRKIIDLIPTVGELLNVEAPYADGRIMWELFKDAVSPGANQSDRTYPSISLYNDKIHVAYQNTKQLISEGNEDIFYHNITIPGYQQSTPVKLSGSHLLSVNPSISASSSGLHMAYIGWLPTDGTYQNNMDWQNVIYRKSTDFGNTWSEPLKITYIHGGFQWIEKVSIDAEGNNIVATAPRNAAMMDIMISNDSGISWRNVSINNNWPRKVTPVIEGNTLNLVFQAPASTNDDQDRDIFFVKNDNISGNQFSGIQQLTIDPANDLNPDMAINGNNIHIVWESDRSGVFQIYYINSTDGGATWSAARQLTDNLIGAQEPKIEVAGNSVAVAWMDYRDGSSKIYVKRSADAGKSWSSDVRITNTTGVLRHMDMVTDGNKTYLVWEKNINGEWKIIYSPGIDMPSSTRKWSQVNTNGFGDVNTEEINSMITFSDNIYVGTWNSVKGAGIWREDGVNWAQVNSDGFGNPDNIGAISMSIYSNALYVGTYNPATGAEVWKYDGISWSDVSPPNDGTNGAWAMKVFRNKLYAGLGNIGNGAEVWRYDGVSWEQIATGGFGDTENREPPAMSVLGDALYVGTWNPVTGGEVWKYDGVNWGQVNTDGFGGGRSNQGVWSMITFNNNLYAGVGNIMTGAEIWRFDGTNWSQVNSDGFGDKKNYGPWTMTLFWDENYNQNFYTGVGNIFSGAGTWSFDGTNWKQESTGGFGDNNNDVIRWLCVYKGALYAGTWNSATGAELWKYAAQ